MNESSGSVNSHGWRLANCHPETSCGNVRFCPRMVRGIVLLLNRVKYSEATRANCMTSLYTSATDAFMEAVGYIPTQSSSRGNDFLSSSSKSAILLSFVLLLMKIWQV
jgi:hypothetical protein